ncbi:putative hydro-lyase [Streptomyces ureilyticus]|uniref:Putative hydro-lyase G6048_22555 n=1 Tax=Streptomyces ureilyticus TaxID=1775131 RepID=A0ABX0DW00_9ACTN|nr:putative hydro-lyase [Streptomyces ureilyticus]NGO44825.1 putative hydro-lyase [Streptomyces ureilyticus]
MNRTQLRHQDVLDEHAHAWSPDEARTRFRSGMSGPTAGCAAGHTQANLISVPADWAYEMLLFCQRNPKPCPVLDVTDAGSWTTVLAPGADLRTDLPRYRVWEHGELVEEPTDVLAHWRDDLVSFLIGCSFTFEWALTEAGVPLRHLEQGRNVSMYVTSRQCRPAGRLHGPMVVSMRPVPPEHLAAAIRETSLLPAVHGSPVHCGEPGGLGIEDLARPDFGDPVDAGPDDIPVFWACGVTPQAAVMASRPPFAITHAPGQMFITDARDEQYRVA